MNFVYLFPFAYFLTTRLLTGSIFFHFIFEWLAAVVLVCIVGSTNIPNSLILAGFTYLAFISLYEIGYLFNDLFSFCHVLGGRLRGPKNPHKFWICAWFSSRLVCFAAITYLLDMSSAPQWWSFFLAMFMVFTLHNIIKDNELKTVSFLWLAWFRFMAPVIFVIQDSQRLGVGLAAAMAYASFRLFGYLDSKGLLQMPGRQRPCFRLFFFLIPLVGALALWPYEGSHGFLVLIFYYAFAAVVGTVLWFIRVR